MRQPTSAPCRAGRPRRQPQAVRHPQPAAATAVWTRRANGTGTPCDAWPRRWAPFIVILAKGRSVVWRPGPGPSRSTSPARVTRSFCADGAGLRLRDPGSSLDRWLARTPWLAPAPASLPLCPKAFCFGPTRRAPVWEPRGSVRPPLRATAAATPWPTPPPRGSERAAAEAPSGRRAGSAHRGRGHIRVEPRPARRLPCRTAPDRGTYGLPGRPAVAGHGGRSARQSRGRPGATDHGPRPPGPRRLRPSGSQG